MQKTYPTANYKDYRPSRNPYWQKIRELSTSMEAAMARPTLLGDEATEQYKGKWRQFFDVTPETLLNLELGSYHGETSIHLAKSNPQNVHLAVEWKHKMCFKGGKKARDNELENMTFLRANNARLPWMVAKGEVDRIWVLFPDPWTKAAHQKWRLLNPGFLRMLGALLATGKELLIKTDHPDYAEYIQNSIKEALCFDLMEAAQADKVWSLIPPTPFERIFLRQGLAIHRFSLVRNSQNVVAPEEVQHVLS